VEAHSLGFDELLLVFLVNIGTVVIADGDVVAADRPLTLDDGI